MTRLPSREEREERARRLQEAERLAWLLDNSIPVPFTGGRRFGIDALIGFVPVVGDFIGAGLGLLVVWRAHRLGVPGIVVVRMLANHAIDVTVGAIPFIGDAFDLWFKASSRNLRLMHRYLEDPDASTRRQWVVIGGLLLVVFVLIGVLIWVVAGVVATFERLFAA